MTTQDRFKKLYHDFEYGLGFRKGDVLTARDDVEGGATTGRAEP